MASSRQPVCFSERLLPLRRSAAAFARCCSDSTGEFARIYGTKAAGCRNTCAFSWRLRFAFRPRAELALTPSSTSPHRRVTLAAQRSLLDDGSPKLSAQPSSSRRSNLFLRVLRGFRGNCLAARPPPSGPRERRAFCPNPRGGV